MTRFTRVPPAVRVGVSVGLVGMLAWRLEPATVLDRLRGLSLFWVGVALALSVPQMLVSAWRWRFTAARLGMRIPLGSALAEYYRAVFLNQILPGGVLGDADRAWRHARGLAGDGATTGGAIRAVVLERASGQVVMAIVAVASGCVVAPRIGAHGSVFWGALSLGAAALAFAILGRVRAKMVRLSSPVARLVEDARGALLHPDAWPTQALSSAFVVATYLLTFLAAARAVGVTTPAALVLPLVAPVLLSMVVPVTIAGWGLREAVASALWASVGLAPEDGLAVSAAYGIVVLVGTLPGAVLLLRGALRAGAAARV